MRDGRFQPRTEIMMIEGKKIIVAGGGIGRAVCVLAARAGYVTAANLPVDGGQVESKMIHTLGRKWGGESIDDPSGGAKGGKAYEPV